MDPNDNTINDINKLIEILEHDDLLRTKLLKALKTHSKDFGNVRNKDVKCCYYCGNTPLYAKGLCRNCYNRAIKHNGDPSYIYVEKIKDIVINPDIKWQKKLAFDVIGDIPDAICDFDESVEYAMLALNDKERNILYMRYKDGITLLKCGEKMNVSKERIRQIQAKAIRKLRRFPNNYYIKYGKTETEKILKNLEENNEKKKNKIINNTSLSNMLLFDYLIRSNVSVRSYNCLVRSLPNDNAHNMTVSDFVDYIKKQNIDMEEYLLSIRNCGRKSTKEIMDVINKIYISEKGDENNNN